MAQIAISDIETTVKQALLAYGAQDWIAAEMAQAVAWAEARKNRICGLYYVESYCQQLASGRVDGAAEPVIERPKPGVVAVDAANGFAQPALRRALDVACEAAREQGVVSVAIRRAHTCTALGYFTECFASRGLAALGMTNASPIVAPPGGKNRVIGTNPMAFAAPDGQGGLAMSFDQSTTTVALGRITMAKAAGESIPEGWAIDAEGRPTTDPEAALKGSLTSLGGQDQGYKGWGFGLMAELLTAGMTGGRVSRDVKPLKAAEGDPHDLGQYFLVIDPEASGQFYQRFEQVAEGVGLDEGTRMPGRGKALMENAEVPEDLWALMQSLAAGPAHA